MRNKFKWNVYPSEQEFAALWKESIFTFDANTLLDLYRVSKETRNDILNIMSKLKSENRIWLSNQAAHEYLKNRDEVIENNHNPHQKALNILDAWKDETHPTIRLKNKLGPIRSLNETIDDFITNGLEDFETALDQYYTKIKDTIVKHREDHENISTQKDLILERLFEIFDDCTGDPYNDEYLNNHINKWNVRLEAKIPPGVTDYESKDDNKYGDLIIWNQVIDMSNTQNKPVIFVTSEKKPDWWSKDNKSQIKGPRVELRKEFHEECSERMLWIYHRSRFIEEAALRLEISLSTGTVQELDALPDEQPTIQRTNKSNVTVSDLLKAFSWMFEKQERNSISISDDLIEVSFTKDDYLPKRKTLYVGNLNYTTTEVDLRESFEVFGELAGVKLIRNKDHRSKGFAFITFVDSQSAIQALDEMNGATIGERTIIVNYAHNEQD